MTLSKKNKYTKHPLPRFNILDLLSLDSNTLNLLTDDWKLKYKNNNKSIDIFLQYVFFNKRTTLEKFIYPLTLFNIFFIGLMLGKWPNWFHIYYTTIFFILIPIRFYTYYKIKSHYFMADLCYFVNLLCLSFIWWFPNSTILFQSCFTLTFGSLSFAVITWKNSLVLHSLDKTTSCFIHLGPTLTLFVIYYIIDDQFKLKRFPGAIKSTNFKIIFLHTSLHYLIWQSLYHYFITMRKKNKIESGQRVTSFTYLINHQFKNWPVTKLKSPWPMIIFIIAQYLYQLFTMSLCIIWLNNEIAATLFLVIIFGIASYNGAIYYIDIYKKNTIPPAKGNGY